MIPRFSLVRPRSLDEAFHAFDVAAGDGWYVAGGTELLQVMKMGFARFGTLVDLKAIPDLKGIHLDPDGSLRIGATSTHREVERSSVVSGAAPGLAAMERRIANPRVRNTGTLGGNLAFAEPHSDPATFLLACGATVELRGRSGGRNLSINEFVIGPLATAREPDEVLVAVRIPARLPGEGSAHAKIAFFERPTAAVGVHLRIREGTIAAATVAVGSMCDVPQVVAGAGAALLGTTPGRDGLDAALGRAADAFWAVEAIDDVNGSADYKRHLAGVLLGRATRAALQEATARA
jgi:aerobic carbon-monoxide dehydrogenase medium subunit